METNFFSKETAKNIAIAVAAGVATFAVLYAGKAAYEYVSESGLFGSLGDPELNALVESAVTLEG